MKKREYRFPWQSQPNGEGCDTRMPLFSHRQSEYTHMWKKNNDGQSLPRMGKVASGASRIGFWRYEKERRRSSQVGDIDERGSVSSTPFAKAPYPPLRGPPSPMGKAKRRRLRRRKRKPTPPRCARQPLPREGARVDTPSFLWKEVPRRGGGWMEGSGMKESEGDRLKYAVCESTLSTAARSPFPNGEGYETGKAVSSTQSLPRVGKVASGASRIGF